MHKCMCVCVSVRVDIGEAIKQLESWGIQYKSISSCLEIEWISSGLDPPALPHLNSTE